ncbi:hypothetical protein AJ80_08811 [Polytolypa hystricis UAMH7299]|uniref:UDP-galactose transporter n=1 Tax=Polytolypa hystricis (strain UAMH7299) TaxID=1447883 RepID=A0A2B7WTL4_POLH7|nr:hypothetical protein AJ80_08811 [Polytolypa hystricis UAMH7299]
MPNFYGYSFWTEERKLTETAQLLHYSRVVPVVGGRRYIPSTAVFLTEVIKLAVCLTLALYDVSKSIPSSMPATSLFSSLSARVFTGDSWKLVVPAALYTLGNSLQYVGLSNFEPATFQVTYQLKLVVASVFGLLVLKRNITLGKWIALLLVVGGVVIVQLPNATTSNPVDAAYMHFPRSFEEFRNMGAVARENLERNLHKRSATYEGIEADILLGATRMNGKIGLLATVIGCIASGLAGVSFEKVLRDSPSSASIWTRNVQLAIYSIFPALFIGVVFLDGEKVAKTGFFEGYNWVVWTVIGVQAFGGLLASYVISYSEHSLRNYATACSILASSFAGNFLFESKLTGHFILGTSLVVAATYFYSEGASPSLSNKSSISSRPRPPPIRIDDEKYTDGTTSSSENTGGALSPPNDFSIKLPTTPLIAEASAFATSRPDSPGHTRLNPARGSYFAKQHRDG